MTSELRELAERFARWTMVLLGSLLTVSTVAAQNIAFAPLQDDRGGYGDVIAQQTARVTGLAVLNANQLVPVAVPLGCPTSALALGPGCMQRLHQQVGVDLLVDGLVLGGARAQSVALVLWSTGDGRQVGELVIPLVQGAIDPRLMTTTVERIQSAARQAGQLRAPAGVAAASPGPTAGNVVVRTPAAPAVPDYGTADRIRFSVSTPLVSRRLELNLANGRVDFDAPYYPGLTMGLTVFPAALFWRRDSIVSGLGVILEFGKHRVRTVTEIRNGSNVQDVEIPTRHDTSYYALTWEIPVGESLTLAPAVGWRAFEYALGNNPLYGSSFYQGVDLKLGGRLKVGGDAWAILGAVHLRPGIDVGSTGDPYGELTGGFGWAIDAGARYRAPFGLFVDAGFRFDRYTTTFTASGVGRTEAIDTLQSFVLSAGYAY